MIQWVMYGSGQELLSILMQDLRVIQSMTTLQFLLLMISTTYLRVVLGSQQEIFQPHTQDMPLEDTSFNMLDLEQYKQHPMRAVHKKILK